MIKQIFAALAGLALCAPVQARIEEGTKPLLELINSSGILVSYNGSDCHSGHYLGVYKHRGMQRAMVLCYGATVDAEDHMVVRHETIHAIQHCVNAVRGTPITTAILDDDYELMTFARKYLSEEGINKIKEVYDPSQHRIEIEAFAGMHAFTADELADMFRKACLFPTTEV